MLDRPAGRLVTFAAALAALATDVRADEPPAQAVPTAHVHVNSPNPAVVEMRGAHGAWQPVCYGACDADLPLGFEYRVPGLGDGASDRFVLEGAPGQRVTVDVTPKVSHRGAMIGLFCAGGGHMLLGGVAALAGSINQQAASVSQNANGTPVHRTTRAASTRPSRSWSGSARCSAWAESSAR
jgi:hypothetical protein